MFKSKKIVALVLCAMMLFVPVAAAANDDFAADFLKAFSDNAKASWTGTDQVQGKLVKAVGDFKSAVEGQRNGMSDLVKNPAADTIKDNKETLDNKEKDYQEALKEVKKAIVALEKDKREVERFGYEMFTKKKNAAYDAADKDAAKKVWEQAVKDLQTKRDDLDKQVKLHDGLAQNAKALKGMYDLLEKNLETKDNLNKAKEAFEAAVQWYTAVDNDDYREMFKAPLLSAWKNLAALLNDYQKASFLKTVNDEDVLDLINGKADKYEVKSTGEKGWILSDEAKNGCLKDVAEFKVEKKDGKFVAKVYGADGKEMKIGQQLTVYRPIAKDVKVLSAKVDGKNVTFATSVRNGQNYVSVPVVY